jgi:hypothetical protein
MRFHENGADIPTELLTAVSKSDAIFLCGAGVSKRAGLPLFDELTEQVYDRIGERRADVAAERRAFDRAEFDRALRSLEKRTLLPRAPSRVRIAVSELLQPRQGVELIDHLALVQLSRDAEGRPKLLTTNFDTLFERAAQTGGFNSVPSHAGKAIPKPGGPNDHGVLHLHGRLADATLGLVETDLVLTSADFGDAYLRDGWASQYVEDRMRLNTLVLVGYAAEDPAMRLLLETLDADRDRFRDLKDIYAIERRSDDSASIWNAKGIKPIEFESYDNMYETLREWARYAMNPREYKAARVNAIFAGPVEAGE